MGKKGRIRASPPPTRGRIPPQSPPPPESIRFSFRHLDTTSNEKFHISKLSREFLVDLLDRLKWLSTMTFVEILQGGKSTRCHPIRWETSTEPDGFTCLSEQLRDQKGYQFQVSQNGGRVHGFVIESTFYIVWLDPDHKLSPGKQ